VTRLQAGQLQFSTQEGQRRDLCLYATTSILALGHTQLPIQWVQEFFPCE